MVYQGGSAAWGRRFPTASPTAGSVRESARPEADFQQGGRAVQKPEEGLDSSYQSCGRVAAAGGASLRRPTPSRPEVRQSTFRPRVAASSSRSRGPFHLSAVGGPIQWPRAQARAGRGQVSWFQASGTVTRMISGLPSHCLPLAGGSGTLSASAQRRFSLNQPEKLEAR